jgi:hypothetical protein
MAFHDSQLVLAECCACNRLIAGDSFVVSVEYVSVNGAKERRWLPGVYHRACVEGVDETERSAQ